MDNHLSFREHIHSIVSRAHTRSMLIWRCFLCKDISNLMRAFIIYVRPILEYCSPVWSPVSAKLVNDLESVQRRFTKRLPGLSHYPYDNRCALLGIDRLEFRRLRADLILCYKIINGLVSLSPDSFFNFNTSHITRGHSLKLHVPTSRINCRQHFFRCSSSQSMEFVAGRGYFCASVICVYFSFEKCEPQQILSW